MRGKPTTAKRRTKCYMENDDGYICCTQIGSWEQRRMETQRKDVKNLRYTRRTFKYCKLVLHTSKGYGVLRCRNKLVTNRK